MLEELEKASEFLRIKLYGKKRYDQVFLIKTIYSTEKKRKAIAQYIIYNIK